MVQKGLDISRSILLQCVGIGAWKFIWQALYPCICPWQGLLVSGSLTQASWSPAAGHSQRNKDLLKLSSLFNSTFWNVQIPKTQQCIFYSFVKKTTELVCFIYPLHDAFPSNDTCICVVLYHRWDNTSFQGKFSQIHSRLCQLAYLLLSQADHLCKKLNDGQLSSIHIKSISYFSPEYLLLFESGEIYRIQISELKSNSQRLPIPKGYSLWNHKNLMSDTSSFLLLFKSPIRNPLWAAAKKSGIT